MVVKAHSTVKKGACPVCGRACDLMVHIDGAKLTRIRRDPERTK